MVTCEISKKKKPFGSRAIAELACLCHPRLVSFPFPFSGFSSTPSLFSRKFLSEMSVMEFFGREFNDESSCPFDEKAIQRCPFLRNINKPTCFSFSSADNPLQVCGRKGPIFEDGPSFDMAFKLFHGKDGVVPLTGRSHSDSSNHDTELAPHFNPLAAKAATISLSAFGPGGPFSFGPFSDKWKRQKKQVESSKQRESSSEKGHSKNREALGNEWLQTGNCPIAKSYRAVSGVLPLVAKALQPPPGIKLQCPPAVVAARAALARTAFVKTLRPQPLPSKMLAIALLGVAVNVPLGVWKEHTQKFSLQWFVAVHAAVPFIAMLRKSVVMPKTAMALTIGASILGQIIGSRAERIRLKAAAERTTAQRAGHDDACGSNLPRVGSMQCSRVTSNSLAAEASGSSSTANVCC